MKKIVIIGSSGAGKSTLARELGPVLKIKFFHLDRFFWERGWKEKDSYARKEILENIVLREKHWIIEGSYLASSEAALNDADTIIFLDLPPYLCLWQTIKRHHEYHGLSRHDIPEGCADRFSLYHLLKLSVSPFRRRKKVKQTLDKYHSKCKKLSSIEEVENFLLSQENITGNKRASSSLSSAKREKSPATKQRSKPITFAARSARQYSRKIRIRTPPLLQ